MDTRTLSRFDRRLLPPAREFYQRELGRVSRFSRGWATAHCPFHTDKHPSFRCHEQGGFYCHTCGVRGGSIVDFVMLRDGVAFKTAAKRLGAWRDESLTHQERCALTRQREKRERIGRAADWYMAFERDMRLAYRTVLHDLEAMQSANDQQLNDPNPNDEQRENAWRAAPVLLDARREAIAAYYLLAFGSMAKRKQFVLHSRDPLARVLERGYVVDKAGHRMEVSL